MINKESLKQLDRTVQFYWREANRSKDGKSAQCLSYIDARVAQDVLDNVCGKDGWSVDFFVLQDRLYAKVSIECDHKHMGSQWVGKSDVGTESNTEKEKGNASDAFKRACVQWGIGRFLYGMDKVWVNLNDRRQPVGENGKRIWDLTDYCNNYLSKKYPKKYSWKNGVFTMEGFPSITLHKPDDSQDMVPIEENDPNPPSSPELTLVEEKPKPKPKPPEKPQINLDELDEAVIKPKSGGKSEEDETLLDFNRRVMGCRTKDQATELANEFRELEKSTKLPKNMRTLIINSFNSLDVK